MVGRVSMDAITVKLPDSANISREFCLMSADFSEVNSGLAFARAQQTIPYEVCSIVSKRVPRLYTAEGKVLNVL